MKIGVCLAGCGVMDGAEIQEAVFALLALDQAGATAICCAPNVAQMHVINHLSGEPVPGVQRNVLEESARIARGKIRDLATVRAEELDGLIFPGGFGAAKNLCNFATAGAACNVHPEVERLIGECIRVNKPIGAICIAPAMLTRVLGNLGIAATVTIGDDAGTAVAIEAMGGHHQVCSVTGCVVDEVHRIVTTPAYMLGPGPAAVWTGIQALVQTVLRLAQG